MNDEVQLLSFLDQTIDSSLTQFMLPAEIIQEKLSNFGLSHKESKIFMFLSKYGSKSAIEITRLLRISRTETYRIINTLQNMGIVSSTIDHPVKFSTLPITKALDLLIRTEIENVRMLQNQRNEIMNMWNFVPSFTKECDTEEEKIQILKGQNSIVSKICEMIHGTQKSLSLIGSEKNLMRLYHSGSLEIVQDDVPEIRILASCSENFLHIFEDMKNAEIRKMPNNIQKNFCMIIRDEKEIIMLIGDEHKPPQDMIAIKTDSTTMTYSMTVLFKLMWLSSSSFDPVKRPNGLTTQINR
jgi:sugar-specific transcriptional regulator TrmB